MIEKKIHYIWLGGEKPKKVSECIESWNKKLPDYEIIEWNEKKFDFEKLLEKNKFLRECYKRKLWAFMSDYLRVKVLYENGGIYLDTDMEIIKSLNPLLENTLFFGMENDYTISFGIVGAVKNHPFMKSMVEFYEKDVWESDQYIITGIATAIYNKNRELFRDIKLYPENYFYPYGPNEELTESHITENTYAIHHWGKSWKKNPGTYYLKYKHLKQPLRFIKHVCKLINYHTKKGMN